MKFHALLSLLTVLSALLFVSPVLSAAVSTTSSSASAATLSGGSASSLYSVADRAELGNPEDPAYCAEHLYASTCVQSGCAFCCSASFGNQCMPRNQRYNLSACSPNHAIAPIIEQDPKALVESCAAFCNFFSDSCESCEVANWCSYCDSSKSCVGARENCKDDKFITDCDATSPAKKISYFTILLYLCVAATTVLLVIFLAACCRRYRTNFMTPQRNNTNRETEQDRQNTEWLRRHQEERNTDDNATPAEDEGAPLLANEATSPANEHGGNSDSRIDINADPSNSLNNDDDDNNRDEEEEEEDASPCMEVAALEEGEERVCQICLDGRPTVVFLPCYHTYCCSECSEQIRPNRRRFGGIMCPFCRAKISAMIDLRSLWNADDSKEDKKKQ